MPGIRHEQLIDEVENNVPGFQRFKFRRSLFEAIKAQQSSVSDEEVDFSYLWAEMQEMCYGVPDGFVIDAESMKVTIYEIEVTGRVSDEKLERYAQMWDWLDFNDWELCLLIVDGRGTTKSWDLRGTYYRSVYGEAPDSHQRAIQIHLGQRSWSEATVEDAKAVMAMYASQGLIFAGEKRKPTQEEKEQAVRCVNDNLALHNMPFRLEVVP